MNKFTTNPPADSKWNVWEKTMLVSCPLQMRRIGINFGSDFISIFKCRDSGTLLIIAKVLKRGDPILCSSSFHCSSVLRPSAFPFLINYFCRSAIQGWYAVCLFWNYHWVKTDSSGPVDTSVFALIRFGASLNFKRTFYLLNYLDSYLSSDCTRVPFFVCRYEHPARSPMTAQLTATELCPS